MPFYKKEHLKAKEYEMKYLPTLQTYLKDDTIKIFQIRLENLISREKINSLK